MSWNFGRTFSNPASLGLGPMGRVVSGVAVGARPFARQAVRSALGRWAKSTLASRGRMASRSAASARTASALRYAQRRREPRSERIIKGAQGGPSTTSKYDIVKPSNKIVETIKRASAPQLFITNNAYQVIATQGFQELTTITWQSALDLKQMRNKVQFTENPTGGTATVRYVLDSSLCELLITNSTLATAFVEIYDIARKRDASFTAFPGTSDPGNAWKYGVLAEEPFGSPNTYNDLTSSPFDSLLFKEWFKVLNKTRVEMAQGALHRHHVNIQCNKIIDGAVLSNVDGDPADYVYYTMVVFKGQPASVVPEGGGSADVTTAKIALDIVHSQRYKFFYSAAAPSVHYTLDNLQSLSGEQVISAGAGTIVPNSIV